MDEVEHAKDFDKQTREPVEIPVESLFASFDEHLKAEDGTNRRIFFSGKYGIGKTYFLNKFFKSEKDKYEVFHLFPVNYQISPTEDIVDLLKYDLLVELTKRNKDLFKRNKLNGTRDLMTLFYIWCRSHLSFSKVTGWGVEAVSSVAAFYNPALAPLMKLGKSIEDSANLIEKFQEFRYEVEAGEEVFVKKYIDKTKSKSILETDYLSELLLEKISEQKGDKESVLILDDLDRIDPEHIFRILNVFSAHLNLDTNSELPSKFGFDKIILVGDRENIESIFFHRYGTSTNFGGYFDKFISIETYRFSNETIVSDYVDFLIKRMRPENKNLRGSIEEHGYVLILLGDVLREWLVLATKEKLNLRRLLQLHWADRYLTKTNGRSYRPDSFSDRGIVMLQFVDFCINFLVSLADSAGDLERTLEEIRKTPIREDQKTRSWLFNQYIVAELTGHDFSKEPLLSWNEYNLKLSTENPSGGVELIEPKKGETQKTLFYDLLLEYFREGRHKISKTRW